MSSLPFPVRVAAGLVVTAVEEVQALPRTIVGLPITAASRVLQLSMRAQQVVTELAIKGDSALEGARPVEEAPSWARFDDDTDGRVPTLRAAGAGAATTGRRLPAESNNGHARPLDRPVLTAEDTAGETPDALPGYETMTIAQLRARLRGLSVDQLTELLAFESAHADRPAFVTMLTNRIATLTAEQ
ncbi:lipid droplet-associated protein [Actinomycetospora sp. TBRC 11914]|uniref:lipid droplet-associated protein n=1 Tax=Actinomycetospora sp. TBRC 11914 TaxID=2729387 RepID=UPI00145CAF9E|nr:lipid droplet-associated protein [Actinomycetospora sp. TBRC 11914]NMO88864.1 lipid droplet-associated protein [Actinomycetospora sp. TBRC 11914]